MFSDDALIITGKVVMTKKLTDSQNAAIQGGIYQAEQTAVYQQPEDGFPSQQMD